MRLEAMPFTAPSVGSRFGGSGSRTATSLNAAFVNGVSGPAVAVRYLAQTTDTIDELYIFLDNNAGTLGNITMAAEIFNEHATTAARTGSTSRDTSTATVMPAAVDKWIKFTFGTPYTPTVGEVLWLVAYNTSASPAVDYPQILTGTTATLPRVSSASMMAMGYTTTGGFTPSGTAATDMPFMIKQGSRYFGNPWTQRNSTYYTNNTRERGVTLTMSEDVIVNGGTFDVAANLAALRIMADATAPGGSALNEYDLDSDANETTNDIIGAKCFDAMVRLRGGTTYKLTLTYSGNSQAPAVMQIEDYSTYSSAFDALRAEDTMICPWGVIDNGAGGWTADKAICPEIGLFVSSFPVAGRPQIGSGCLVRN